MELKTPNNCSNKGLSIVELILAILIISILVAVTLTLADPTEHKKKARDNKRLVDISTLERIINEYYVDNEEYPDSLGTLRTSTTLPSGNSGPAQKISDGWIDEDLSYYDSKLPVDPVNDSTYNYSYIHSSSSYELNAVLEFYVEYMVEDGGNNENVFESGNNLNLL